MCSRMQLPVDRLYSGLGGGQLIKIIYFRYAVGG